MNRTKPIVVVFALVISFQWFARAQAPDVANPSESLAKIVKAASKSKIYVMPDAQEIRDAERMFLKTMHALRGEAIKSSAGVEELTAAWAALQMKFQPMTIGGRQVFILTEAESDRRGRGLYAFDPAAMCGGESPARRPVLCLQSPHSFFDKHTRAIGVRLFETGEWSMAGWNTVKRSLADFAHQRQSYFSAYTRAFALCYGSGCVLQLHGYSQESRKTPAGAAADMIVSNGTRRPNRHGRALVQQLRASFPEQTVALFPDDVRELGATTNAQGGELRGLGHTGFLHLEMSSDFRNALRREDATRRKLLQSILTASRM